jgi:formamidopyrimidine-DNA glycosylase
MPQMQALADRLSVRLSGAVLQGYEPLGFSGLKTVLPAPESLVGSSVVTVGRRGKYLVFDFGGPRLLIHLSQAGRLDIEEPPKRTKPKGSVVRLRFADPEGSDTSDFETLTGLLVREHGTERKAGWWVLAPDDDGPLEKLGPEPDSEAFAEFVRTSADARRIHTLLRDQRTVAGVGRGYADDALHRARLSPYATLKSLDAEERERLLDAVRAVLADGLERERARTGGLSEPKLGGHFVVHGKAGVPCPVCGDDLKRVSYESHEVVYCPRCQTGGKVLADRRLSRLIR